MSKKSIRDIDVAGKKVLVRCDFNVPMSKTDGTISDDKRIRESLPTIKHLLSSGARVILCSHMGRPKGEFNEKFTLKPVAHRLSELLGFEVPLAPDVIGDKVRPLVDALEPGRAILLENVRFYKEEEKNDPAFAKSLADMAEIYVNDAFGTAHRAHASTAGVAAYLPAVCGFLIEKELSVIGGAISDPKRPFVAILGGAKVSDKIGVIDNLLNIADAVIIGGGMAYTFLKAQGLEIGKSLCDDERIDVAKKAIEKAKEKGVKFYMPVDVVCAAEISEDAEAKTCDADRIPADLMGLDIGEKTIKLYSDVIASAKTVIWNGPMGVFEVDKFARGTRAVAEAMAASAATTIIGGGDSASAAGKMGLADKMTHISTGGGATLEYLEGIDLPGIAALNDK
ncbi:MAG: phosphoglycerate kinase [Clostridia bacterium]|nr:phosphoglycerate kinase [Clostridia bacterium]